MHIELAHALVPVLQDPTTTGAPVPEAVDDDWADAPDRAGARLWDAGSTHGSSVSVDLGQARPEQQEDPVLPTPRKLGAVPWTGSSLR